MFWLIYFVINKLFGKSPAKENLSDPIDKDWISIVSTVENMVSTRQRNRIINEIDFIKIESDKMKIPDLDRKVRSVFDTYDTVVIHSSKLTPNLKYAMIKLVFDKVSTDCSIIFDNQLVSLVNFFCPDIITVKSVKQIVNTVWLYIIRDTDVDHSFAESIIFDTFVPHFLEMWIKTVEIAGSINDRMGILPAVYNGEYQAQQKYLKELKDHNNVDAKFNTTPDPIRRRYLSERYGVEGLIIDAVSPGDKVAKRRSLTKDQKAVRDVLLDALIFRDGKISVRTPDHALPVQSNFRVCRSMIDQLLFHNPTSLIIG